MQLHKLWRSPSPKAASVMTSRSSPASLPSVPWYLALGHRFATLWIVKMIGTTLGISGFFFLYFWVMHNPPSTPTVMPLMPIDHWVAVSDDAMLLYGSLWFYISLAPAFAKNKAELWACARGAATMAATGLAVFWFFPTTVPVFAVDWSQYPALQFLKATHVGGKAFPSLHVAFAVFTAMLLGRQLRSVDAPAWTQWVNLLWAFGIVYSTLATRQHVLLDVIGGTLLAVIVSWARTKRKQLVLAEA